MGRVGSCVHVQILGRSIMMTLPNEGKILNYCGGTFVLRMVVGAVRAHSRLITNATGV